MLKPLNDGIFFIFTDDVTSTKFINKTKTGFLIAGVETPQSSVPRPGVVIKKDLTVDEVDVGDYILVEPGMWTRSFDTGGIRMWKTDISKVMLQSSEPLNIF